MTLPFLLERTLDTSADVRFRAEQELNNLIQTVPGTPDRFFPLKSDCRHTPASAPPCAERTAQICTEFVSYYRIKELD